MQRLFQSWRCGAVQVPRLTHNWWMPVICEFEPQQRLNPLNSLLPISYFTRTATHSSWLIRLFDNSSSSFVRLLSVLRGHSFFPSPPQRPMTSDSEGFLYQIFSITLFSYLNSWKKSQYFPFSMLSAKQWHNWYHFYNLFGMTLEASTLPLGYRGGDTIR